MKKLKKWLAGLLCAVMAVCLLPATALASETLSDGTLVTSEEAITRAQLAEMVYEHDRLTVSIDLMGHGNPEPSFTDIDDKCTDDQKTAITALAKAQIISGTSEDEFSPGGFVTRGEAVVVIWRATGSRSNKTATEIPFTKGVEPWYEAAVNCFYGAGMLKGTDSDDFGGGDPIPVKGVYSFLTSYDTNYATFIDNTNSGATTRAQMVEQFYEYFYPELSKMDPTITTAMPFTDIGSCTEAQKKAIQFFYERGIISGATPTTFVPYGPVSNLQVATLLQRCAQAQVTDNSGGDAGTYSAGALFGVNLFSNENPFTFLKNEGINVSDAESNPNAPALTTVMSLWNNSLVPAVPGFTPTAGWYSEAQDITITSNTSGAKIYYTTDKTTPTTNPAHLYSTPIHVDQDCTITAVALKNNLVSAPSAATYTIGGTDPEPTGLTLTPSTTARTGGGTVTLTVGGAGSTAVKVTCTSHSGIAVSGSDTDTIRSVTLPNTTDTYTFVAFQEGGGSATCTVAVTRYDPPALTLTPSTTALTGGGTVTLTVGGAEADTTVSVTCTSHSGIAVSGSGSTWWVTLPNATASYTFTAAADGYTSATYTVHVTRYDPPVPSNPDSGSSGSSGSTGGVTGSGDDVSVSSSGGSVTSSQMESAVSKADEGAPITIQASNSTSVTLPAKGMADAADNENDIAVNLRSGEVILSAQAIAGLTDGVPASSKVKIYLTSLTSAQDETISDLMDKGAAVFDVTVEVGGKSIHSFDGSLTLTFTVPNLSRITDPHVLHILTDGTKEYYAPDRISGNTITVKGIRNLSTFAVIPGSEVPKESANPFVDVTESDYYYDAVLWAVENGVTTGTGDAVFSPDTAVTRAQMVTFLWRAHGSPKTTGSNAFKDVSSSDYYYDAVLWAVENGVTNGTSATTFSPDAAVTRAQAVTFQWRAAGSPVVSGSSFGDVRSDAYYVNAVTCAVTSGITIGTGINTFSPDMVVSRAQAVTFLYRELAE